jgi:hypothetical protein
VAAPVHLTGKQRHPSRLYIRISFF